MKCCRELEKVKERKAGDGGKPVCMLTKTQKAVHVCELKQRNTIHLGFRYLNSEHLCHYYLCLP